MADRLVEHPRLIPHDLYRQILAVMPIVCVDLMVTDVDGKLLLLRRRDEPAKDQWWLPGGRVHLGETRVEAASRKLNEECGLSPATCVCTELLTADVILPDDQGSLSHGVTTVFRIEMSQAVTKLQLDLHSQTAEWRTPAAWLGEDLHPFVRRVVATVL